jgi:hypothetical protein
MVMERFGSDVQKIFEKAGKKFSRHTVCALALRLVNMICKNTVSYNFKLYLLGTKFSPQIDRCSSAYTG